MDINMSSDTIAAIATAMSPSGIGIVRISGDEALAIIDRIYRSKNNNVRLNDCKSHTIHYGYIYDGDEVVDDIHQKGQAQDAPQDLGMLQLLSGGIDLVGLILVLHQQGGIDGDGTLPVRVHGVVDEGHGQQHHGAHRAEQAAGHRLLFHHFPILQELHTSSVRPVPGTSAASSSAASAFVCASFSGEDAVCAACDAVRSVCAATS